MHQAEYGIINSLEELESFFKYLESTNDWVGFDLETGYTGEEVRTSGAVDIAWRNQYIVGFSLSTLDQSRYVPIGHDKEQFNLPEREVWELSKPYLEKLPLVAHNAAFEVMNCQALERKGRGPYIYPNIVVDSMLVSYVHAATQNHGLKIVTLETYGHKMTELMELFEEQSEGKKFAKKKIRFNSLDITKRVIDYACEDAFWSLNYAKEHVDKAKAVSTFIYNLEHAVLPTVIYIDNVGVRVDWDAMKKAYADAARFKKRMQETVIERISESTGQDYSNLNLNSHPQIQKVLFDKPPEGMGLAPAKYSDKTGKPSADSVSLNTLAGTNPAIKKLLEYREVTNLFNRFKTWLNEYEPYYTAGRVYPSYNQALVPSGRFSANNPAIQQLPKYWKWALRAGDVEDKEFWSEVTSDEARNSYEYWAGNFRDFIIAEDGWYLVSFDLSQAELRMIAGIAGEDSLVKAFEEGLDVHVYVATMMFGLEYDKVTDKQRQDAKTLNFALAYSLGIKGLADRLGRTIDEAKKLHKAYFDAFPKIKVWFNKLKETGEQDKYVITPFGRKVVAWDFYSDKEAVRNKGFRVLGNAPAQGGAADYMKVAMVKVRKKLEAEGLWDSHVKMIMNQHDSLVFEVREDVNPQELRKLLMPCVEFDFKPGYPKVASDWEFGYKWGSVKTFYSQSKKLDADVVFADGKWSIVKKAATVDITKEPDTIEIILPNKKPDTLKFVSNFLKARRAEKSTDTVKVALSPGYAVIPGYYSLSSKDKAYLDALLEKMNTVRVDV